MPGRRTFRVDLQHLLRAEWNGAGRRFAESAHCFRATVQFIQARRDRIKNQFCHRYDYARYNMRKIEAIGGAPKTQDEVVLLFRELAKL